jgi:hypothetical protein
VPPVPSRALSHRCSLLLGLPSSPPLNRHRNQLPSRPRAPLVSRLADRHRSHRRSRLAGLLPYRPCRPLRVSPLASPRPCHRRSQPVSLAASPH